MLSEQELEAWAAGLQRQVEQMPPEPREEYVLEIARDEWQVRARIARERAARATTRGGTPAGPPA